MRITLVYGAITREVTVERTLDGRRHRLVISCGWRQPAEEVYRLAAPYLTHEERAEVRVALGLEQSAAEPSRPVLCAHADDQGHGMHWLQPGERCPSDHAGGAS